MENGKKDFEAADFTNLIASDKATYLDAKNKLQEIDLGSAGDSTADKVAKLNNEEAVKK